MTSREETWHAFVDSYEIDVPEEAIENELAYITLEMKHRMQYDRLSGGELHLFPAYELAEKADELHAAAVFEAKAPRVVKAIVAEQGFTVTLEELQAEAQAVAERQGATLDMMKMFFGEDFSMLERDVLEQKAIDWACAQAR